MVDASLAEIKAIRALRKVAKTWPKSLWLYSASGTLHVMRADNEGNHFMLPGGGVDPEHILADINIPNSGGDW